VLGRATLEPVRSAKQLRRSGDEVVGRRAKWSSDACNSLSETERSRSGPRISGYDQRQ
jgi:hypothetical protein